MLLDRTFTEASNSIEFDGPLVDYLKTIILFKIMLKIPCRQVFRAGSRTAATFKMERFVIIVNDRKLGFDFSFQS